jgi:DNA-binding SARP family transcriptional activator
VAVEIRVLGPVEIWSDGRRVPLSGARQRLAVAALAVDANRPVPLARLVDVVWDGNPPSSARRQVQDLVARFRRALIAVGAARQVITTTDDGYELRCRLDAHVFAESTVLAKSLARDDPGRAAEALRTALAMWRGSAFAGLDRPALRATAQSWDERRVAAHELLLRLDLELGRVDDVIDEVAGLMAEHPLRESLVELRMSALFRAGRRAESLTAYHELRRRLAEELGIDPGPQVQARYVAILRVGHRGGGSPPRVRLMA